MHMNTAHKDFSPQHELLCSLPKTPHFAYVKELKEDLGLETQWAVHALVNLLREDGFDIGSHTTPRGRIIQVNPSDWGRAKRVSRWYWKKVNGQ